MDMSSNSSSNNNNNSITSYVNLQDKLVFSTSPRCINVHFFTGIVLLSKVTIELSLHTHTHSLTHHFSGQFPRAHVALTFLFCSFWSCRDKPKLFISLLTPFHHVFLCLLSSASIIVQYLIQSLSSLRSITGSIPYNSLISACLFLSFNVNPHIYLIMLISVLSNFSSYSTFRSQEDKRKEYQNCIVLCTTVVLNYILYFCVLFGCLVVNTSAFDCLERPDPEMTNYVLSGTLNSTQSQRPIKIMLNWACKHCIYCWILSESEALSAIVVCKLQLFSAVV